jgi:uncharacterized protein (TIGR03067 family)
MRLRCLLLFAALLGVAGFAPEDDTVKKEREKFKGTWFVTSYEVDGKEFDSDKIKRFEYVFDLEKVTVKANSQERESTYTVNPSAKPKTIDLVWKDKTTIGIYQFDGDNRLTLCLAREGEKKRPKQFASKERTDVSLLVLKRAKQ